MIKTVAIVEGFTKDELFENYIDLNRRRNWDSVLQSFKILETKADENYEIIHFVVKVNYRY
jgi:hypothetical protein